MGASGSIPLQTRVLCQVSYTNAQHGVQCALCRPCRLMLLEVDLLDKRTWLAIRAFDLTSNSGRLVTPHFESQGAGCTAVKPDSQDSIADLRFAQHPGDMPLQCGTCADATALICAQRVARRCNCLYTILCSLSVSQRWTAAQQQLRQHFSSVQNKANLLRLRHWNGSSKFIMTDERGASKFVAMCQHELRLRIQETSTLQQTF